MNFIGFDASSKFLKRKFLKKKGNEKHVGVAARIPASYGGEQLLFSNKHNGGRGGGREE